MPVQFKATFEQPLLADITAGQVFGGDALAEKIAQYYNLTIQAGTPIGTAPGTGTFTTSSPREQLMANILKLYYKTADITLLKDNIEEIGTNINNLQEKGRILQSELLQAIDDQRILLQDLALIGIELERVVSTTIRVANKKAEEFSNIANSDVGLLFEQLAAQQLGPFVNLPDKYITKIETIQALPQRVNTIFEGITPFNLAAKLQELTSIPSFILTIGSDLVGDFTTVGQILKSTLDKLNNLMQDILRLIEALVNPKTALTALADLVKNDPDIREIVQILDNINRRLDSINKRLRANKRLRETILERITREVTTRIEKYQIILERKGKELALKNANVTKLQSKIQFIAEKVEVVNAEVKERVDKALEIARQVDQVLQLIQRILQIVPETFRLVDDTVREITTFIEQLEQEATQTVLQYEQLGSLYQNEYNALSQQFEELGTSTIAATQKLGDLAGLINNPVATANAILVSAAEVEENIRQVSNLFTRQSLSRYSTVLLAPVFAGLAGPSDIANFLERRADRYNQLYVRGQRLLHEALDSYEELEALLNGTQYTKKQRTVDPNLFGKLSAKEFFVKLNKLFAKLDKVKIKLEAKVLQLTDRVERYRKEGEDKLKEYAKTIFKKQLAQVESAKEEADSIKAEVDDEIQQKRDILVLAEAALYAGSAISNGVNIANNLAQGNILFRNNESQLRSLFRNYSEVSIRILDERPNDAILEAIKRSWLKLDAAILIGKLMEELTQQNAADILNQLRLSVANNQAVNSVRQAIINFIEIIQSGADPLRLVNFVLDLRLEQFTLTPVQNYLYNLEQTFYKPARIFAREVLGANDEDLQGSLIIKLFELLQKYYIKVRQEIENFVATKLVKPLEEAIKPKEAKIKKQFEDKVKARASKRLDAEGKFLTFALYQSLLAFWTGATWQGVGVVGPVIVTSPGILPTPPANIPAEKGIANYVAEIARIFQQHLQTISGTYVLQLPPPAAPQIVPWAGYN